MNDLIGVTRTYSDIKQKYDKGEIQYDRLNIMVQSRMSDYPKVQKFFDNNSTDIKTSLTDFIISFEKHLTEEIEFYKLEIENVIMEN